MNNSSNLLAKLKDPRTSWKYILFIVVFAFIIGGGIFGYLKYFEKEVTFLAKFQEMKKPEKFVWKTFSIDKYGFSMRIGPNAINGKKEKILWNGEEFEAVTFYIVDYISPKEGLWTQIEIDIIVEGKLDIAKKMRSSLLEAFKSSQLEGWEKAFYHAFGLSPPAATIISKEKIEKDTCVGILTHIKHYREEAYDYYLALTSLNLEDMFITLHFRYSYPAYPAGIDKETQSKILKMVETIRCTR